jgi:ubiquinone/menaquinone biosynthesis C-methylase UbiE
MSVWNEQKMFHGLKALLHWPWRTKPPEAWTDWICPVLSVIVGAVTLALLGLNVWTAAIVVVLLTCPVVVLWSYVTGTRPLPVPLGPAPATRGRTLNWLAPFYDGLCRIVGLGRSFRDRTLAVAALKPGETVLDVGCGTGVLARRAAGIVGPAGSVVGIDPAPDMIRVAQQTPASRTRPARFRLGVIESLPFEAASVDVVLASLVLHHLPPDVRRAGLREVFRVLRPGGRVVVVDFDRRRSQVTTYLSEAGFVPVVGHGRWRMLSFVVAFKPPMVEARERERLS